MAGGGDNNVRKLGKQFSGQLGTYLNTPAPEPSAPTVSGANALADLGANAGGYSQSLADAISSLGATAAGKNTGFESNVIGDTNAAFGASGRYGSNLHAQTLADALAAGRSDRQLSAAAALPGLFSAQQAPALAQITGGSVLDANADPQFNRFAQLLGLYNQSQGSVGFQQQPSLLQQLMGAGLTGAGIYGSIFDPIKL